MCEEVDGQGTVEIREAFEKGNVAQKMNAVSYLNYKKRKTGPLVRKHVNVESQNSEKFKTNSGQINFV